MRLTFKPIQCLPHLNVRACKWKTVLLCRSLLLDYYLLKSALRTLYRTRLWHHQATQGPGHPGPRPPRDQATQGPGHSGTRPPRAQATQGPSHPGPRPLRDQATQGLSHNQGPRQRPPPMAHHPGPRPPPRAQATTQGKPEPPPRA